MPRAHSGSVVTRRRAVTTQTDQASRQFSVIRRNPLAAFFVITVALGWIATLILSQIPAHLIVLPLLAPPIRYIPAVIALLVLRASGSAEERMAFRQRLTRWRVGLQWYVVALL